MAYGTMVPSAAFPARRHLSPAAERRRDELRKTRVGLIPIVLLSLGVGTALARREPAAPPAPQTAVAGVAAVADPAEGATLQYRLQEWQEQRRANGQDPHDWSAYRAHAQALGGPDPGEAAPEGFGA